MSEGHYPQDFCDVDILAGNSPHEIPCEVALLRNGFTKKVAALLDFVQMRGGAGAAQNFRHLFISEFLVNKRSLFPPKCQ